MASSAFKSTSKRSCDVVSPPSKPSRSRTHAPSTTTSRRRRSRSVVSPTPNPHHNQTDNEFEFSKRDNPLFSRHHSPPSGRRFRSLSRNPSPTSRTQEETDQECDLKSVMVAVERPRKWSTAHPVPEPSENSASECCSLVPNWDYGGSGICFSEAEEKTIDEFSQLILSVEDDHDEASSTVYENEIGEAEVVRSIREIPNDGMCPGPVELVLDIRREYVKELELSEERARKLRADLAAEEHRGVELGRVLKELLPDSRVDNVHRSRFARKNSNERRRMSKRLTDEAMAYFDECISISTFDSSDLSSLEDPSFNLQASAPVESTESVARGRSIVRTTYGNCTASNFHQESRHDDTYRQHNPRATAVNNSIVQAELISSSKSKSNNSKETWSGAQDNTINNNTNKENGKQDCAEQTLTRKVDMEEYNVLAKAESMLFDKVFLKNRIDTGSMLLCEGVAFYAHPSYFIS